MASAAAAPCDERGTARIDRPDPLRDPRDHPGPKRPGPRRIAGELWWAGPVRGCYIMSPDQSRERAFKVPLFHDRFDNEPNAEDGQRCFRQGVIIPTSEGGWLAEIGRAVGGTS
jgi:hypothetical protein